MKVTLNLPEGLAEQYLGEANDRDQAIETILEGRLKVALPLSPAERFVIVMDRPRQQLEEMLGGGSLTGAEDLVYKVRRLARIHFGEHEIPLTPGQLEELAYRARKVYAAMTPEAALARLIKDTWESFAEQFFGLVK